jgi:hypothetical protein
VLFDGPPPEGTDDRRLWDSAVYAIADAASGVLKVCVVGDGLRFFWSQSAAPPPSAAELEQAATLMLRQRIVAPEIGTFPGEIDGTNPDITGILGWPIWLWAKNPGEGIAHPVSQSTMVAGYTLRATARLVDIVYDTGDGQTVRCGLGSPPPQKRFHHRDDPPPVCGHTYWHRGYYTITATTHVAIDWSGAGRSGTIPVTVDRSGVFAVAEIQALIVPDPPR